MIALKFISVEVESKVPGKEKKWSFGASALRPAPLGLRPGP
jgi:hypothetical protein